MIMSSSSYLASVFLSHVSVPPWCNPSIPNGHYHHNKRCNHRHHYHQCHHRHYSRQMYSSAMYLLLLDLILSLLWPLPDSWPTNSSNHPHQKSTLNHPQQESTLNQSTLAADVMMTFVMTNSFMELTKYLSSGRKWNFLDQDSNFDFVIWNQNVMKSAVSWLWKQMRVIPNLWGIKRGCFACTDVYEVNLNLFSPNHWGTLQCPTLMLAVQLHWSRNWTAFFFTQWTARLH